jgi:hypothetical protein
LGSNIPPTFFDPGVDAPDAHSFNDSQRNLDIDLDIDVKVGLHISSDYKTLLGSSKKFILSSS